MIAKTFFRLSTKSNLSKSLFYTARFYQSESFQGNPNFKTNMGSFSTKESNFQFSAPGNDNPSSAKFTGMGEMPVFGKKEEVHY